MLDQVEELIDAHNVINLLEEELSDFVFQKRRIDEDETMFYLNIISPIHPLVNGVIMDYINISVFSTHLRVYIKCKDSNFIEYLESKYIGNSRPNGMRNANISFDIKDADKVKEFIQKDIEYLINVVYE